LALFGAAERPDVGWSIMASVDRFKKWSFLGIFIVFLLLSACAQHYTSGTYSDPYGFFSGVWHGIIFSFALIANLISWLLSIFDINVFTDIQIIGRPNTGFFFYYIGFVLGLSALGSSCAADSN
jgi:hypothetical protein